MEKLPYLLCLLQRQRLPDVGDVVKGLQLRHAGAQHHGEQVDEQVGMLPDGQVGFVTHFLEPGEEINVFAVEQQIAVQQSWTSAVPLKLFGLCTLLGALADDDEEVLRQDKGHPLSLVAKFLLLVIQKMTKIYMKQL